MNPFTLKAAAGMSSLDTWEDAKRRARDVVRQGNIALTDGTMFHSYNAAFRAKTPLKRVDACIG